MVASAPPASMMSASSSLDHPRRVADRMRAGRAGGDHRMVGAHQPVFDRDLARDEVDQPAVDEVRADTGPGPSRPAPGFRFRSPASRRCPSRSNTPARSFILVACRSGRRPRAPGRRHRSPKTMNGSTWRWTLWSTRLSGSKPYSWSAGFTSQAILAFWSEASKRVIGPTPLLPTTGYSPGRLDVAPSGVTRPETRHDDTAHAFPSK